MIMINQAQQMAQRHREYVQSSAVFLTLLDDSSASDIRYEPNHPLLHRPRWIVRCRKGSSLSDVQKMFESFGWPIEIFMLWKEKNGNDLVRRNQLRQ